MYTISDLVYKESAKTVSLGPPLNGLRGKSGAVSGDGDWSGYADNSLQIWPPARVLGDPKTNNSRRIGEKKGPKWITLQVNPEFGFI